MGEGDIVYRRQWGDFVQGNFVWGDFVLGGILSRGILCWNRALQSSFFVKLQFNLLNGEWISMKTLQYCVYKLESDVNYSTDSQLSVSICSTFNLAENITWCTVIWRTKA